MSGARVLILMGSKSDWPVMKACADRLAELGISYDAHVASAHRTPEEVRRLITEAEAGEVKVFIAGAGVAAHLAGAVAASTTLPVIGVPIDVAPLQGFDALLSTVQMPPNMPVLTVAIGKAGAVNAAVAAAQILATADDELARLLRREREVMKDRIRQQDRDLQHELGRPH